MCGDVSTTQTLKQEIMIEEQVLNALSILGFRPEAIEDFGYRFDYEDLNVLYSAEDDEAHCITMAVPGVFEVTDENRHQVLEAMADVCGRVKYAQPVIAFKDHVWINYQHYVGENEITPELIEHMVRVLAYATIQFHKTINGETNDD